MSISFDIHESEQRYLATQIIIISVESLGLESLLYSGVY